jgi:hypothetical protein
MVSSDKDKYGAGLDMKALRILILVLTLPVFVSAVLADASDQGGSAARTLQISSSAADLDLLCDKLKQPTLSGIIPHLPNGPRLVHTPSPTKAR